MTAQPDFGGSTFDEQRDGARLRTQLSRVRDFMSDGEWRTLAEIAGAAHGSEAAVSARLRDLRRPKHGGHVILRKFKQLGLWQYQMKPGQ